MSHALAQARQRPYKPGLWTSFAFAICNNWNGMQPNKSHVHLRQSMMSAADGQYITDRLTDRPNNYRRHASTPVLRAFRVYTQTESSASRYEQFYFLFFSLGRVLCLFIIKWCRPLHARGLHLFYNKGVNKARRPYTCVRPTIMGKISALISGDYVFLVWRIQKYMGEK